MGREGEIKSRKRKKYKERKRKIRKECKKKKGKILKSECVFVYVWGKGVCLYVQGNKRREKERRERDGARKSIRKIYIQRWGGGNEGAERKKTK